MIPSFSTAGILWKLAFRRVKLGRVSMICDQLDFVYIAVGEMLLVNMPVMQGRLHIQLGCYDDACNLETHTTIEKKGRGAPRIGCRSPYS